jgi:prepilin-type N-terminal cleavage/methylation domain-containing protein
MNANRRTRAAHQAGVTLVEMMVAVAVGLILMAGIIQLFVSNKQAYRIQEGASVLNENARYAVNQIQYHLRLGDHWGGVETSGVTVDGGISLPLAVDCTESPVVSGVGLIGFEDDSSSPLDCIAAGDYVPNTDVIVVRYGRPVRVPTGSLANNTLYVRSAIGRRAVIFEAQDIASLGADIYDPADEDPDSIANFAYATVIYFIRPCASQDLGTAGLCDAADDDTPTLARYVLEGNTLVQEDVIAGVEQMQLTYGVDMDGDLTADRYDDADTITAANDWPSVVNVRMSLVIRNDQIDVTYTDDRTYRLYGGYDYEPVAADQKFRRKLFNFVIQVRNQTRA